MESLEGRRHLSVSPYVVVGTAGNDVITVSYGSPPVVVGRAAGNVIVPPTTLNQTIVTINGVKTYPTLQTGQTLLVHAGDGHDKITVIGSRATDLWGGTGDDTLIGGSGHDTLFGETGNDSLDGGLGNDLLKGGSNSDTVSYATRGNAVRVSFDNAANDGQSGETDNVSGDIEIVQGGYGNDYFAGAIADAYSRTFYGNAGNDVTVGGEGSEIIHGGAGDDVSNGGDGHDQIFADSGNDNLYGNDGSDTLYGGTGVDYAWGGIGNDLIITLGGGQKDKAYGQDGEDSFWTDSESGEIIADATPTEKVRNVHRVAKFEDLKTTAGTKTVSRERDIGNLPDPAAVIDGTTYAYKSFKGERLFQGGAPSPNDVNQGKVGDCYFLSPLSGIAKKFSNVIRQSVIDLGDGTYAVQMRRDGVAKYIRVDADLPVNDSGNLVFAGKGASGLAMWVPVMEKAWAFFRYNRGAYAGAASGQTSETFKTLGMKWDHHDPYHLINDSVEDFGNIVANLLSQGKAVTFSTDDSASLLVKKHSYMVDRVIKSNGKVTHVVLRNPWANDGPSADSTDDGYVTLTTAKALQNCDDIVYGNA